jgi:hypothetical protein
VTDAELKRAVRVEALRELRAEGREREERDWNRRLDDALARRGYIATKARQ